MSALEVLSASAVTDPRDLEADLRWWAAANYLTAAQIDLKENPLLREPLQAVQIKPRLLPRCATGPGRGEAARRPQAGRAPGCP
ncbi:hypothetical protein [Blastococcus sp. URHD0036]|uniref:hypothetical protein n=1 Tax=Blastococcus sp. URHD0036 TaxID=1380356 RepID=UPI0009DE037C|nr:hypothetical protein [Blastococcus sp. URHD0036]